MRAACPFNPVSQAGNSGSVTQKIINLPKQYLQNILPIISYNSK